MRILRAIPVTLSLVLILLGLAGVATSVIGFVVTGGGFLNEGVRVTVPASVELTLETGKPHGVYHEINGSHVTLNQPFADLPADTVITLTDGSTGQPIEAITVSELLHVEFFGLRDHRLCVRTFTPPASGLVRLDVSGSFDTPQVLYLGPTHQVYVNSTLPKVQAGLIGASMLILLGAAGIVARISTVEPMPAP
jgi:hypothetical protein